MCAAEIKIYTDNAIVKYKDQLIGEGAGVYELQNPIKPNLSDDDSLKDGISRVLIVFGDKGEIRIRTREHDTDIHRIVLDLGLINLGKPYIATSEQIIFGESYGHGRPRPIDIVDSTGEVLATVKHKKTKKTTKEKNYY